MSVCSVTHLELERGRCRTSDRYYSTAGHGGLGHWDSFQAPANAPYFTFVSSQLNYQSSPGAGRSANQLVYYWSGLEPAAHNAVIQPVLQWGHTGATGGGAYWTAGVWYVVNDVAVTTPQHFQLVNNEDMDGQIYGYNCSSSGVCTWAISASSASNAGVIIYVQSPYVYSFAYGEVMEPYYVTACNQYPVNEVAAESIDLSTVNGPITPTWTQSHHTETPACSISMYSSTSNFNAIYNH